MATLAQLAEAIKRADAAGNAEDVRTLGAAYRAMQAQQQSSSSTIAANLGISDRGVSQNVEMGQPIQQRPDLMNSTVATVNGLVNGIPIVGPIAQNMTDAIGGTIAQVTGGNFNDYMKRQKQIREQAAQAAPVASLAGEMGGMLTGYGALAKLPGMAQALGFEGPNIWARAANSGLSQLGIGTADSLARGQKPTDALAENLGPAGVAAALPFVGAGVRMAGKTVNDNLIKPVASLMMPENAATANLAKAVAADTRAGAVMSAADQAGARAAGIPVVNADTYGPAVRRLTRTATNIDGESAAKFSRLVEDRFKGQGLRAENFVKSLMGGATDDLALKDALRAAADKSNGMAYAKAFNDPAARAVWTPQIAELMQSPAFQSAVNSAESRAADKAAIAGLKAVKNPFTFAADGTATLKINPDGSRALPTLQFWDQVKRNIDSLIDKAKPTPLGGGDRALYADLTQIKNKLVGALDSAVPSYAQARAGAAGFFGATDAIDAGRKAVTMTKQVPELERAVMKFTPAERDAASVGYASEIIDSIRAAGDNRNLMISNLFNTPSARARNALFLGQGRARELEAYVRWESAVDALRGAVKGNSSTAEQLIAAGAVGTGVGLTTGDWRQGLTWGFVASLGMRGLKVIGKNVDAKIMQNVAERLLSSDPAVMQKAIQNAALSQKHMDALEGIMRGLALVGRAGVATAGVQMAGAN